MVRVDAIRDFDAVLRPGEAHEEKLTFLRVVEPVATAPEGHESLSLRTEKLGRAFDEVVEIHDIAVRFSFA
jgi:hypothetical protein